MKKKMLTVFLAFTMALSTMPTAVFAAADAVDVESPAEDAGDTEVEDDAEEEVISTEEAGETEETVSVEEVADGAEEGDPAEETASPAEPEETRYVTMNVPYDDFYAAYDLTDKAVWDVNGEGLDAVSTATGSKFKGTDGLANGTYNDGTYILGVTIPVAVKAEDYASLDATLTEGNYAFTDLTEAPAAYSELTVEEDGTYSFSALQAYEGDTTGLSVAESANGFTTAGYGDYQIDLEGVATAGTLANGVSYGAMYGAILHIDNGKALGMTALENLWFGTRVTNVEIAWSVTEGQGLKRAHGSGSEFYQFSDICGQKLTQVDIITSVGIISIPCDITLTPYYTGDDKVTVNVKDDQTLTVAYPSELEDVKVSVSYKDGRATKKLADEAAPEDGVVALNAALNELETSYTVTVYSSNYAPISTTLTYGTPALEYYKAQLTEKKEKAAALVAKDETLTTLAAHVAEAEELLANEEATTAEVQALISELDELMASVKYYVTMNVPYDDFYAAYDLTDKAVWDVNGEGLDAVSTATESKFKGTTGLANGTYNDGTYILGVTIPVVVNGEDYLDLDDTLTEGNYAFTDLTEAPAVYSELTVNKDGSYSFGKLQNYEGDTTGLSVTESANGFTTAGYGDYQIDLEGVATAGTLANDDSYGAMYGAILHTDNGEALGMTALENLWFGTRVTNVEIAWSVAEGQGLKRGHGSGDAFYQFSGINGQTLTQVDLITSVGVISIPCDITLTPYYNGEDKEVTAEVKDEQSLKVVYPSALEDVQVSVSYRAGRASTTLADKARPEDGVVALNAALNELETSYTVTVYSSNYAPISTTLTYGTPAFDYYKAQLTEKKDQAAALVAKDETLTTLAAHVAEAEELLAKEDATTAEFQTLISELDELIAEATAKINLQAAVDSAKALKQTDYTADSWKLLQDEISEAESLIATGKANQSALDTQQADLEQAITNLVKKTSTTITAADKKTTAATKVRTFVLNASASSKGTLTYSSDSAKITVDKNGKVTIPAYYVGKATITIKAAATDNYKGKTKTVTVTITKANKAQSMTVKAAKTSLKVNTKKTQTVSLTVKKANGKVTYKSSNSKVKISSKGVVKIPKNFKGTVKITVKAAGDNVYKAASKTITIKVK